MAIFNSYVKLPEGIIYHHGSVFFGGIDPEIGRALDKNMTYTTNMISG